MGHDYTDSEDDDSYSEGTKENDLDDQTIVSDDAKHEGYSSIRCWCQLMVSDTCNCVLVLDDSFRLLRFRDIGVG